VNALRAVKPLRGRMKRINALRVVNALRAIKLLRNRINALRAVKPQRGRMKRMKFLFSYNTNFICELNTN
jgi:hypothetical protein